jgi:hypothetical protein
MNTNLVATQYKLRQWADVVRECRASGMKVREWCALNGISKTNYYYRLRCVREAALLYEDRPEIVEIPQAINCSEVVVKNEKNDYGGLSISLGNSIINVDTGTPPQVLTMVLEVMGHVK